jgi:flagellar motor protein MotB
MRYSALYHLKILALIFCAFSLLGLYLNALFVTFYLSKNRPLDGVLAELSQLRQQVSTSQHLLDSYLKGQQQIAEKLSAVQEKLTDRYVTTTALDRYVGEIGIVLKRYQTAETKTDLDPTSDFLAYIKKSFDVLGPVPQFGNVAEGVANFLRTMVYEVGKEGVDQLTRIAICHFWPGSCQTSSPVIVALTVHNVAPQINPSYSAASLNLHTSIWYPKSDSADDQGEVERTVLPLITKHIGARTGCVIFVDGNADTVGADSHNIALSDRRARAVAESLTAHLKGAVRVERSASGERNTMKITRDNVADIYNRRTDVYLSCK